MGRRAFVNQRHSDNRQGIQVRGTSAYPDESGVIEALQSLPRMLHNPFVFFGREGQPLHNGIKHSDWQKYLKQAGIKNLGWHVLRHTFASRLVMRIDLYTVKTRLR